VLPGAANNAERHPRVSTWADKICKPTIEMTNDFADLGVPRCGEAMMEAWDDQPRLTATSFPQRQS